MNFYAVHICGYMCMCAYLCISVYIRQHSNMSNWITEWRVLAFCRDHICISIIIWLYLIISVDICLYHVNIYQYLRISELYPCIYTYLCISVNMCLYPKQHFDSFFEGKNLIFRKTDFWFKISSQKRRACSLLKNQTFPCLHPVSIQGPFSALQQP